mmetsp:Transcript_34695/g.80418  ORF Transcript_34695/g.80418 Transcript_34695/m.80418 type:complete len:232 (-) Transcript_34695:1359-2054(-)
MDLHALVREIGARCVRGYGDEALVLEEMNEPEVVPVQPARARRRDASATDRSQRAVLTRLQPAADFGVRARRTMPIVLAAVFLAAGHNPLDTPTRVVYPQVTLEPHSPRVVERRMVAFALRAPVSTLLPVRGAVLDPLTVSPPGLVQRRDHQRQFVNWPRRLTSANTIPRGQKRRGRTLVEQENEAGDVREVLTVDELDLRQRASAEVRTGQRRHRLVELPGALLPQEITP